MIRIIIILIENGNHYRTNTINTNTIISLIKKEFKKKKKLIFWSDPNPLLWIKRNMDERTRTSSFFNHTKMIIVPSGILLYIYIIVAFSFLDYYNSYKQNKHAPFHWLT